MTREEFIESYVERSRVHYPSIQKTEDGFVLGSRRRIALPCNCGDDECKGWAMVSSEQEDIDTHMQLYAPSHTI
jgi:hypothetical protein